MTALQKAFAMGAMGAMLALMVDAWVVPMELNSAARSPTKTDGRLHDLMFRQTEVKPASAAQADCAECHQTRAVPNPAVQSGRDAT